MSDLLRIDIISDVVCPWCIIGYRQLSEALEFTGTPHEIHWHPFELNRQCRPRARIFASISPGNTASPRSNRRKTGRG